MQGGIHREPMIECALQQLPLVHQRQEIVFGDCKTAATLWSGSGLEIHGTEQGRSAVFPLIEPVHAGREINRATILESHASAESFFYVTGLSWVVSFNELAESKDQGIDQSIQGGSDEDSEQLGILSDLVRKLLDPLTTRTSDF